MSSAITASVVLTEGQRVLVDKFKMADICIWNLENLREVIILPELTNLKNK